MEDNKNILRKKSYDFALAVVQRAKFLKEKNEFILSKQFLRSGTAIGALIREAEYAQSKADFINKLSITLKEANETEYWIDLLNDSGLSDAKAMTVLKGDCKELLRLLIASLKTLKNAKDI